MVVSGSILKIYQALGSDGDVRINGGKKWESILAGRKNEEHYVVSQGQK